MEARNTMIRAVTAVTGTELTSSLFTSCVVPPPGSGEVRRTKEATL